MQEKKYRRPSIFN